MKTEKRFLNVKELASFLSISRKHCYEIISRGIVPGVSKVKGVGLRIDKVRILEWIEQQQIETVEAQLEKRM